MITKTTKNWKQELLSDGATPIDKPQFEQMQQLADELVKCGEDMNVVIDEQTKQAHKQKMMHLHQQLYQPKQKTTQRNFLMNILGMNTSKWGNILLATAASVAILIGGYSLLSNSAKDDQDPGITQQSPRLATVEFVEGTVEIRGLGETWVTAQTDMKVEEGDQVRTGEDGQIDIQLPGGSYARLGASSQVEIRQLVAPTGEEGAQIALSQTAGEIYNRVVTANDLHPTYTVEAGPLGIEATGTAFVSGSSDNNQTGSAKAIEHTIKVTKNGDSIDVSQGKEVTASKDTEELKAKIINKKYLKSDWIKANGEKDQEGGFDTGVLKDLTPPDLTITSPLNGSTTDQSATTIQGSTEVGARVWINGKEIAVGEDSSFSKYSSLSEGINTFTVTSKDASYNRTTQEITVTYTPPEPEPEPTPEPAPDPDPEPTTSFVVTKTGKNDLSVSVAWTFEGYGSVDGFKILAGLGYDPSYPSPKDAAVYAGASARSGTITMNKTGTYTIRVCVYNSSEGSCDGSKYSNSIEVYVESPSSVVNSITLSGTDANISWTVDGYSSKGFKVVWSKTSGPTYPLRDSGDKYHYYSDPNRSTDTLDTFDGAGTYYARVCEYLGGSCGKYSNEITVTLN